MLLVVMLALTFALTACNNTKTLSMGIRWVENETKTYVIGLQDTTSESNIKEFEEESFVKDNPTTPTEYDRIKPSAVSGTYTTELTINGDQVTYKTTQVVEETYSDPLYLHYAATLYNQATSTDKADQYAFLNATQNADMSYTFTSTIVTEVTFENNVAQTPVSSTQKIQGYYIGQSHVEINDLEYQTTYENGVATVKEHGNELYTCELADGVVDALQIPLVVRSLDQSKNTSEGKYAAPAVSVYDFKTNKTVALSLTVYDKMNVLLNIGDNYPYAVASVVTVGVQGYSGFLYTFTSNPQATVTMGLAGKINTYEQVRFQSEYYTYEVDSYTADEVEDLKYVSSAVLVD